VDMDGAILGDSAQEINPAGFVIHSAIHMMRPDVTCIIHTHTVAGMAVAAQQDGLLPISMYAIGDYERVGYHDYEGPSLDPDERRRLAANLGRKNLLILRNHGLLVCGASIAQAFSNIFRLETACRIQVDALSGGLDNAQVLDQSHFQATRDLVPRHVIEAAAQQQWTAVRRMLDRTGAAVDA